MDTGQKFELNQFVEFANGSIARKDIFKGQHFNVSVICLDPVPQYRLVLSLTKYFFTSCPGKALSVPETASGM